MSQGLLAWNVYNVETSFVLKFMYSEKPTNFWEISTLLLFVCTVDKSKVKISQNFVAFSESTNFIAYMLFTLCFEARAS